MAVVSHVPHLTAATLMALAADLGEEHGALLQLAAGGFRDMTRIAAGQPSIWPGICDDNAEAIVATLDLLIDALGAMRRRVAERDHGSLLDVLERAATARRALSDRAARPEELVEVRIPVLDRPGTLAEVAVLATELGINIFDVEIAHSVEGDRGVLVVVIDAAAAPDLRRGTRRQGPPVEHLAGRDGPVTRHAHRDPGGAGWPSADRRRRCARGQVDLPPGPAPVGPGRRHLDHHRAVRPGTTSPAPGTPSRRLGAAVSGRRGAW